MSEGLIGAGSGVALSVAERQHPLKGSCMNSEYNTTPPSEDDDDMLPEYDFSKQEGVRGKYYRAYHEGHTVTIHHADGRTTTRHYQPDKDAIVL